MPIDIFHEIDIPVVTIIWQYTGLGTPEMEQRVTTYSQYALSTSVTGIRDIGAQTLNGISVQRVFVQPDVNLDLATRSSLRQSYPRSDAPGDPGARCRPVRRVERGHLDRIVGAQRTEPVSEARGRNQ
jgi:hypothetical protein